MHVPVVGCNNFFHQRRGFLDYYKDARFFGIYSMRTKKFSLHNADRENIIKSTENPILREASFTG